MHQIDFKIKLTGSKLFDIVMYNTANDLCAEYPGLEFEYDKTEIRIFGELNDYWYEKYQQAMFYNVLNEDHHE